MAVAPKPAPKSAHASLNAFSSSAACPGWATTPLSLIEAMALASPDFQKFAEGKAPKKVIVVPGRLVNVVL